MGGVPPPVMKCFNVGSSWTNALKCTELMIELYVCDHLNQIYGFISFLTTTTKWKCYLEMSWKIAFKTTTSWFPSYIYDFTLLILKSFALFILIDKVQLYRRKFCDGHIILVYCRVSWYIFLNTLNIYKIFWQLLAKKKKKKLVKNNE